MFSKRCPCERRQQREELPAPITPTICWTPKRTLVSTPTSSSLCLSLFDSVYLSLCISLPLYLISLPPSVFSLREAPSLLPSSLSPLIFFIYSPLSLSEASQRTGWGWVVGKKRKVKYITEECGERFHSLQLFLVKTFSF